MKTVLIALRATAVTLVLTGLIYPLVMTGLSKALFRDRANGSMIADDKGQVVGSELLAQNFERAGYFQPRPSAAGDKGYDATSSGGSNLGPTSKKLRDRVTEAVAKIKKDNPDAPGDVPAELVTASGSGLDPHLSPTGAMWQVPRVAKARAVSQERVRQLVEANIEGRDLGFLGEPRVNVLSLNLALDRQFGALLRGEEKKSPEQTVR
jgi:K+-transporting ATPase ATPase C chain